jgi:hypothetical protein
MSERATRPLNQDAVKAADDELYAKHEDDPRPNALYDSDGNRRPLDANDPGQAGLREEWMDAYKANGGTTEPVDTSGGQPDQAVLPCGQQAIVNPLILGTPNESDGDGDKPEAAEQEDTADDDSGADTDSSDEESEPKTPEQEDTADDDSGAGTDSSDEDSEPQTAEQEDTADDDSGADTDSSDEDSEPETGQEEDTGDEEDGPETPDGST